MVRERLQNTRTTSVRLNKTSNMIATLLVKVEPAVLLSQDFCLALKVEEKKSFQTSLDCWFSFYMGLSHQLVERIRAFKSQRKHGTVFPTQEPVCMHAKLERIQRNLVAKAKSALTFLLHRFLQVIMNNTILKKKKRRKTHLYSVYTCVLLASHAVVFRGLV